MRSLLSCMKLTWSGNRSKNPTKAAFNGAYHQSLLKSYYSSPIVDLISRFV